MDRRAPSVFEDYPLEITPLSAEEGGGCLITFPDLPGCMSDGETPEEAVVNGRDAFGCWMAVQLENGWPTPLPGAGAVSGRFVMRTPRSLHARLARQARDEGVSMNSLAVALLAEDLGRRGQFQP